MSLRTHAVGFQPTRIVKLEHFIAFLPDTGEVCLKRYSVYAEQRTE
jgi:hypothetical protein